MKYLSYLKELGYSKKVNPFLSPSEKIRFSYKIYKSSNWKISKD